MTYDPVVLFRRGIDLQHEDEYEVAKEHFRVETLRSRCPDNSLIIARYSALPFYRELTLDLETIGSRLINSYEEHNWISNFDYYDILKDYTPESWDDNNFYKAPDMQPYVVKGRTNSRKQKWNQCMLASDKEKALEIASELASDPLIGPQGIIYRKYVPLKCFSRGLFDIPYTNEWRFFYYKSNILSYGYYWSTAPEPEKASIDEAGTKFAQKIADIVKDYTTFFVLDVAEKADGGWILIEINDGQMSGLSLNNPSALYGNLKELLPTYQQYSMCIPLVRRV